MSPNAGITRRAVPNQRLAGPAIADATTFNASISPNPRTGHDRQPSRFRDRLAGAEEAGKGSSLAELRRKTRFAMDNDKLALVAN